MLVNYAYVGLFVLVAVIFASVMLILPIIFRFLNIIPKKPTPIKNSTFECGMETIGRSWVQFNFRYYFYALMFIALDIMAVFLYPWAVGIRQNGYFGLVLILIFIVILLVGYIYAWKKRVLEWK